MPVVYRSAWKRRLTLVLLGAFFILLSKAFYLWLCWCDWQPPSSEYCNPVAFMGVLRPDATSSTLPCIQALEPERRQEALLLIPEGIGNFRPIYPDPLDPDRWVDSKMHQPIHALLLSFDPAAVWAAYQRTKEEHLSTHGFSDGYRLIKWHPNSEGDYLELMLNHDNGFGPYTRRLTIYTQSENKLKIAFASTHRIVNWRVLTRQDPKALLVNYTNGIAGYRWRNGRFDLDETVKREYWKDFLGLGTGCSEEVEYWCGSLLFLLAVPCWFYRAIKFLWLKVTGRPYRKRRGLRLGTLGCLTPFVLFFAFIGILFSGHYFSDLAWSARVNMLGWALITIAAFLPNRRLPTAAVPASATVPLAPRPTL